MMSLSPTPTITALETLTIFNLIFFYFKSGPILRASPGNFSFSRAVLWSFDKIIDFLKLIDSYIFISDENLKWVDGSSSLSF